MPVVLEFCGLLRASEAGFPSGPCWAHQVNSEKQREHDNSDDFHSASGRLPEASICGANGRWCEEQS
jgi:hypothetical protein